MIPFIIAIVLIGGFWFVWTTFFQKKFNEKYIAAGNEAQQKFDQDKEAIVNGYLTDRDKYGILSEAVGPDEKILGIASYAEPKSIGKSLTEELKTTVTNVRKVNMDLYFIAVTDKNLHCIESNGENTVDHTVFDLATIQNPKIAKASPLNIKNAVTGTQGDLNCFEFTYKDKKYSYNLYKYLPWYPRFDVSKDSMSGHYVRSFPGQGYTQIKVSDPVFQFENLINTYFYNGFKETVKEKLGVEVPV